MEEDFKTQRALDHGAGVIRAGCQYSTVEAMLQTRMVAHRECHRVLQEQRAISDRIAEQLDFYIETLKKTERERDLLKEQLEELARRYNELGLKHVELLKSRGAVCQHGYPKDHCGDCL